MKIIVTVHQFLPEYSAGTEVIALGIARELQERGHEVVVVTGYPDPRSLRDSERFDRYTYDGLRVERFRHSPHPMGDQQVVTELAYDNRLFARAFDRLLAEVEPDVVHFLARLSAWLIEPCVERGIPTVFTVTDFWPVCPDSQLRLSGNELCPGPDESALNCIRHFAEKVTAHPVSIPSAVSRAPNWLIGHFDHLIGIYAEAFGDARVTVLPYELLRDDGPRFVRVLEERLGLEHAEVDVGRVNPSLSPEELYWYPRISRAAWAVSRLGGARGERAFRWYAARAFDARLRPLTRVLKRLRPGRRVDWSDFPAELLRHCEGKAERLRNDPLYAPYAADYLWS